MRSKLLAETLVPLVNIGRATLIEGAPGLGKTQVVQQVAKSMQIGFVQLHAPLMQPEDYGMPVVNADRSGVTFVVPDKFPMEGNDAHPDKGILLIDELPQADNAGQKILANLIQERELHGRKLKPGWTVIATGNRQTDRAGANRILSHLRNRVTTLEFEPHLEDWIDWAFKNGIDGSVISFLRFKSSLLHHVSANQEINPTPRGWAEGVSPILGKVPVDAEFEAIKGVVGEGPAAEFSSFLRIWRDLPDPDEILKDPKKARVPTEQSTLYALCGALSARANRDNFGAIVEFMERCSPEFMVLCIRDCVRKERSLISHHVFVGLASGPLARHLSEAAKG